MDFTDKTMHHLYARARMYIILDQMRISCNGKFIGFAKMSKIVYESSLSGC